MMNIGYVGRLEIYIFGILYRINFNDYSVFCGINYKRFEFWNLKFLFIYSIVILVKNFKYGINCNICIYWGKLDFINNMFMEFGLF